jgi:hypothetical protein
MTVSLNPKITQAGLAIAPSAQSPGLVVTLTHVALGTGLYIPDGTETGLRAEVARFAITSGTNPAPRTVQVGCTITDVDAKGQSPNGKGISEIGFYAGSTLFAIWALDTGPLFYKTAAFDVPMAYTLDIAALPANAVNVSVDPSNAGLAALILAHEAKTDPHPQYLTQPEADGAYTPLAHASATDPHTQYMNKARADAGYAPLSHTTATDPHTQYLNKARADAGYVKQGLGGATSPNQIYMNWDGAGVRIQVDGNNGFGDIAFQPWVQQQIANLVGAAPGALDQLNELAAAIGNDPNFASTLANQLAGKERKFDWGTRLACGNWSSPVGWVTVNDDSTNNRMMRVVPNNGSGAGGIHDPTYNNVVPSHTHGFTTGTVSSDHSHYVNDPGHSHGGGTIIGNLNYGINGNSYIEEGQSAPNYERVGIAGAFTGISVGGISANHTHSGSTDNGSSQTNWTPRYLNIIIIEKQS